jgi:putative transposase
MEERGVEVDHSTLNRWVVKYVPLLDQQFRARKRAVGLSWRMDETYVKVKGSWKYLYRAVDKAGATVDFLLTAKRDRKAALRFLRKAIGRHGIPEKITIDKSGANTAAIESYNAEHGTDIEIRQIKYLNNIIEQDHRAVKRVTRPMLGFKSFRSAAATLAGVETHAHDPQGANAREGQIASSATVLCAGGVNQFIGRGHSRPHSNFATKPQEEPLTPSPSHIRLARRKSASACRRPVRAPRASLALAR